jgi:hypothetical protein
MFYGLSVDMAKNSFLFGDLSEGWRLFLLNIASVIRGKCNL